MSQAGEQKQRRKGRLTNKGSLMLRDNENDVLFTYLGKNNYSVVAGVAQLLQAHPNPNKWALRDTGVIVLVKDYQNRAYFLRLFDITGRGKIFEQQLYENFRVTQQAGVLLSFEGDDRMFGLNFSRADECNEFKNSLNRLYEKEQRDKRKNEPAMGKRQQPMGVIQQPAAPPPQQHNTGITSSNVMSLVPLQVEKDPKKKKEKKKKTRLTTKDISAPSNFVHKVHVGWNENEGFSLENVMDPTITELLKHTGYNPEDIKNDASKRRQLQDFAQQYGGLEGLAREYREEKHRRSQHPQQQQYPAPPSAQYTGQDSRSSRAPPPAIPEQPVSGGGRSYQQQQAAAPAPPPPPRIQQQPSIKQQAPPPPRQPPVGRPLPNPPNSSPSAVHRPAAVPPPPPPAPPVVNAPQAPPPPPAAPPLPPSGGGPPPPAPPPPPPVAAAPKNTPPISDGRANLLADIRSAGVAKLRPVGAPAEASSPAAAAAADPKSDLMSQIRSAKAQKLKHVEPNEHRKSQEPPAEGDGSIADALRRAMEARVAAMRNSDSESEDSEENSDWDD